MKTSYECLHIWIIRLNLYILEMIIVCLNECVWQCFMEILQSHPTEYHDLVPRWFYVRPTRTFFPALFTTSTVDVACFKIVVNSIRVHYSIGLCYNVWFIQHHHTSFRLVSTFCSLPLILLLAASTRLTQFERVFTSSFWIGNSKNYIITYL